MLRREDAIRAALESLAENAGDSVEMQVAADVLTWVLCERRERSTWLDGYLLDDPDSEQRPISPSEN